MPFEIVSADIVAFRADAIVNPTDGCYSGGGGVDLQIHEKCGRELDEYLSGLSPLHCGEAKSTPGFALDCKFIIHTSGPRWGGGDEAERTALGACYRNSIVLARSLSCSSIVFPLIGSRGKFFPPEVAFGVAVSSIRESLHGADDIMVYLTVVDGRGSDRDGFALVDTAELNDLYSFGAGYDGSAALGEPEPADESGESRLGDFACPKYAYCGNAADSAGGEDAVFEVGEALRDAPEAGDAEVAYVAGAGAADAGAGAADASAADANDDVIDRIVSNPSAEALGQLRLEETFAEMLSRLLREKNLQHKGVQDRLFMSNVGFWKLLKGVNRPSKLTVFAMAFAMKLTANETADFLMKAGFTVNRSSAEDVILYGFIRKGIYNRLKIDSIIRSLDLSPLPGADE